MRSQCPCRPFPDIPVWFGMRRVISYLWMHLSSSVGSHFTWRLPLPPPPPLTKEYYKRRGKEIRRVVSTRKSRKPCVFIFLCLPSWWNVRQKAADTTLCTLWWCGWRVRQGAKPSVNKGTVSRDYMCFFILSIILSFIELKKGRMKKMLFFNSTCYYHFGIMKKKN
jgi:hypothetical protein